MTDKHWTWHGLSLSLAFRVRVPLLKRILGPAGATNPGQTPRWRDGFVLRLPRRALLFAARPHPCHRRFGRQQHVFRDRDDGFCMYCGDASEERLLIGEALGEPWAQQVRARRAARL